MSDLCKIANQIAQDHMRSLEYSAVFENDLCQDLDSLQAETVLELAQSAIVTLDCGVDHV